MMNDGRSQGYGLSSTPWYGQLRKGGWWRNQGEKGVADVNDWKLSLTYEGHIPGFIQTDEENRSGCRAFETQRSLIRLRHGWALLYRPLFVHFVTGFCSSPLHLPSPLLSEIPPPLSPLVSLISSFHYPRYSIMTTAQQGILDADHSRKSLLNHSSYGADVENSTPTWNILQMLSHSPCHI